MRSEMDGCLPLEPVADSKGWFFAVQDRIGVNTGRAGIYAAILDRKMAGHLISKVYIPLYCCDTVKCYLQDHGLPIEEYNLADDFTPALEAGSIGSDTMIVWPNYYGCMPEKTVGRLSALYGEQLIIDNTQAFFAPPPDVGNPYCVYSCRKFIGVADGAYVIHMGMKLQEKDIPAVSLDMQAWKAPVQSYLSGANSAYHYYLENGKNWATDFSRISPLTHFYMQAVDFEAIQTARARNFAALHAYLQPYNQLREGVDFTSKTAYTYPFLTDDPQLRDYLHENHIFVSRLWKKVLTHPKANAKEKQLANCIHPLPVDQRYNTEDMKDLAALIMDFLTVHTAARNG